MEEIKLFKINELSLNQKNVLYYLFEAAGRTFSRKKTAEETEVEPFIVFSSEGNLNKWLQDRTNLGHQAVHNALIRLKINGYYHTEKINNRRPFRVIIDKVPEDSLVDKTPRIPDYLKKNFFYKKKNGSKGKFVWTVRHQLVYEYVNYQRQFFDELYERGLLKVRCTVWNLCNPKASVYQKASTIAKAVGLTIDQVKLVLRQFKVVFGERAWRRPTYVEIEERLHTFSNSWIISLPPRKDLRSAIEKFEKRCIGVEDRNSGLKMRIVDREAC